MPSLAAQGALLRRRFSPRRTSSHGRSCSSGCVAVKWVSKVVTATTATVASAHLRNGCPSLRAGYDYAPLSAIRQSTCPCPSTDAPGIAWTPLGASRQWPVSARRYGQLRRYTPVVTRARQPLVGAVAEQAGEFSELSANYAPSRPGGGPAARHCNRVKGAASPRSSPTDAPVAPTGNLTALMRG